MEIDFGGCRCQAALLTGNAANTDPVCTLSPNRARVDAVLDELNLSNVDTRDWNYRTQPGQGSFNAIYSTRNGIRSKHPI